MADPPLATSLLLDPPFDDLFVGELPLPPSSDDLRDLNFDFDFNDISVDDFLSSPREPQQDHPHSSHASPDHPHSATDGSALSSSSSRHQERSAHADHPSSPDSGDSSAASGVFIVDHEVKAEEKAGWCLKRKVEADEDGFSDRHIDPESNPDSNPRCSKFRRGEEESPPCIFGSGSEEEGKRKARLMRNRESAQLSRQRKKQYVEELEDKVKSMHSTINELNSKISYIMAENASLRHQLGGSGAAPSGYAPPGAITPMHFPWVPGYALRPHGSQVPLVPIPRLKPQQAAPAPKVKKTDTKKGENKTKKVASVSLMGLLFMLILGGVIPTLNFVYLPNEVSEGLVKGQILSKSKGRILSIRGSGLNSTDEIVPCSAKKGFGEGDIDRLTGRRCKNAKVRPVLKPTESSPWPSSAAEAVPTQNSSENLPALLYVPRNGKHVKINGNLIIHSVLASEKAMQQAKARQSSDEESNKTSLAVAGSVISALAISKTEKEADQHSKSYRIPSDTDDTYLNKLKSTSADGPLQQWFREGMTGPILSSGMCTEVFQFEVSPSSSSSEGIIPTSSIINASSVVNASENLPSNSHAEKIKSRRMMYSEPIPLRGTTINNTEQFEKSSENSNFHDNKPVSSVVVSILADPREAGDGESDGGRVSPNSLSRIFVVVLLDSVKYATYSCVLPFISSTPHLVN
ncbi:hypothetical protein Cni_G25174 [Canna indica]|uniref:BZIP domain-containing protein n=1 Tax=Canna indica TaxID=4628 RepID=A0AAQ3KZL0_9LILI|nr:hypothetical protein Cni_G25174 [Canna indica]